ncbi:transcription factor TFIIH [Cryptosporidium ubiquitum]|uniref:General transcription factor IIH subunit 4 n=1 Tax=Cryptosporidium ubiquitum TaxID=857276 RepID=A0A1J4MC20_9CRYT|nr:transcription factor TFIIH [Cryptosporidium ubiquitum]OII71776.1 transcription factor TFIIH [Cryptosporidium ubiquitum]
MPMGKPFYSKISTISSWNLQEYIATLSSTNACLLFENISCVTELFSSLSELQKNIVSRLMILGNEHGNYMGEKAMNIWVLTSKKNELEFALKKLRSLKIIKVNVLDSSSQKSISDSISVQYQLNPIFQKTLTKFIFEGGASIGLEVPKKISEIGISYISLTRFVRRKWNNILNIIVELSGNKNIPRNNNVLDKFQLISRDTIKVLDSINLISWNLKKDFSESSSNSKGFRIQINNSNLLQDSNEQLFDGFDQEDRFSLQNDQNALDIYNDTKYEVFESNSNSEEEYLPANTKKMRQKKSIMSIKHTHTKSQMDKIFEQKLTPKAFCWLLCDTCSQLLILLNGFIKMVETESSTKFEEYKFSRVNNGNTFNPTISSLISLILSISSSKIGQPISITKKMMNNVLIRFILFAYDLGLVYIDESTLESEIYPLMKKLETTQISCIELFYTTPFSLLIGSEGFKLQSLYSVFKVGDNFPQKCGSENIQNLLLPLHFYFDEELWHKIMVETSTVNTHQPNRLNMDSIQIEAGIIVQSNFRIYCYTASPLQAKILRHLCQVKVRGPNIICGILSRKGLLSAYSMGVSAEQILRFFSSNAHPMILRRFMLEGTSIVPMNVETQLKLWEKDRNRLKISHSSTFSDWGTSTNDIQLYSQTVLYAKSKDILLYNVPIEIIEKELNNGGFELQKKIILVIKQEYEDDIKTFIRTKREVINR